MQRQFRQNIRGASKIGQNFETRNNTFNNDRGFNEFFLNYS